MHAAGQLIEQTPLPPALTELDRELAVLPLGLWPRGRQRARQRPQLEAPAEAAAAVDSRQQRDAACSCSSSQHSQTAAALQLSGLQAAGGSPRPDPDERQLSGAMSIRGFLTRVLLAVSLTTFRMPAAWADASFTASSAKHWH